MQAILVVGCRARLAVQLKLLMWAALFIYYIELYTDVNMVAKHWGLDQSVAVMLLAAKCAQAVAVTVALISESSKYVQASCVHCLSLLLLTYIAFATVASCHGFSRIRMHPKDDHDNAWLASCCLHRHCSSGLCMTAWHNKLS